MKTNILVQVAAVTRGAVPILAGFTAVSRPNHRLRRMVHPMTALSTGNGDEQPSNNLNIHNVFDHVDEDGNGWIDREQFAVALQKLGVHELLMQQQALRDCETTVATSSDNATKPATTRPKLEDIMRENGNTLEIQPIGRVRSVYRLCVGTPRQGLLAPHSRGRIDLNKDMADAIQGLEEYSHVWILFIFHLNTVGSRAPKKISPPALGGRKMGVLATRTPHRPNPVGVTLARLDRIETNQGRNKDTSLYLSGLDLVDGTPVVDIKPFVPTYDTADPCRVPDWVAGGLALQRKVTFSDVAHQQLTNIIESNPNALTFYGPAAGEHTTVETLANIRACIQEVLAMDVRSQYQTRKARDGRFKAERADRLQPDASSESTVRDPTIVPNESTQQLDNLLIRYELTSSDAHDLERETSQDSSAEDYLIVKSIELLVETG